MTTEAADGSVIVTLLFTDIEGSSRLWEATPGSMRLALPEHNRLLKDVIGSCGGDVFKTVGDGFYAVFDHAPSAVNAAHLVQERIQATAWPDDCQIRVRVAVHTAAVDKVGDDYFGPGLNRLARLLATCSGGETLVTSATAELARDDLPKGVGLTSLGPRKLRDIPFALNVFRLEAASATLALPVQMSVRPLRFVGPNPGSGRPFIGRHRELTEISGLLTRDDSRVVTITGSGGIGKTRLACRVAETLCRDDCMAVFIDCGPFETPDEVMGAMMVGHSEDAPTTSDVAGVIAQVDDGHVLFVLDSMDRLGAQSQFVQDIVGRAPGARFLVTSRTALRIDGESEFALAPLSNTIVSGGSSEAMELFKHEAQVVDPEFKLDRGNRSLVREVCEVLQGVPLSIRLAAARLRLMSLEEVHRQILMQSSQWLGPIGVPDRHVELRSVLEGSLSLLSDRERRLVGLLSWFSGGFYAEDAVAVCGPIFRDDVFEHLAVLRDHSLLQAETHFGRIRYWLLDAVREYFTESVQRESELKKRHLDRFLAVADSIKGTLQTGRLGQAHGQLVTELGNLRQAMNHALQTVDLEAVRRMVPEMGGLLIEAGMRGEYEKLSRAMHDVLAKSPDGELEAMLLGMDGAHHARSGNRDQAREAWERRRALALESGDLKAAVNAELDLADLAQGEGREDEFKRLMAIGLRKARHAALTGVEATARAMQSAHFLRKGDKDAALRRAQQAEGVPVAESEKSLMLHVHRPIALAYQACGKPAESERNWKALIRLAHEGQRLEALTAGLIDASDFWSSIGDPLKQTLALRAAQRIAQETQSARKSEIGRRLLDLAESGVDVSSSAQRPWREIVQELTED